MKLASCHPNRKMQAKGLCKNCYDKQLKISNPKYKQAQMSNTTRWAKANPEKYKIIQKRRQDKDRKDPSAKLRRRNSMLKRKYGITHGEYLELHKQQNGGCALCFRQEEILHVDHNHDTGRVRGLLCHQCNWYLGTIDADPKIIDRIIKYRF